MLTYYGRKCLFIDVSLGNVCKVPASPCALPYNLPPPAATNESNFNSEQASLVEQQGLFVMDLVAIMMN